MSVQPFSIFISYRFVEFSKLRTRLILKLNSLGLKCNIHDLGSDKSSRSAFPATPSIKSTEIVANHTSLLILLLGDTYSKGIIEKEYDTAIERGIPILPYYIGKYGEEENYYPYEKPKDIIEDDDTYIKLCKFKKKVRENGELCGNHLLDWSAVEGIPARSKSDYAKRVEEIAKEIFDNVSEVFQHALLKGFSSYIISRKHYGVPKLPNNYIHREKETVAIREMLLAELGQGNRVAGATMGIAAMGGTGKSVIATKLAKDEFILNHFNSGIFWVEVNQVPDVRNLLQLICTQIDIVVDESSSLELLNSKLEEYFYSKTILLVLDDVWDIRHLKQFHFINDSSKTLITTKFKRVLGDSVIYDLGQLSPQQALELLKKKVDTVTEENLDLVEKILKETGGLALAVDIVSSMMRGKITEYWESILKNLQGSKISSIHNRRENKLHDSLHIVIDLSVQTLTTEAKQGLLSLAIFPEGYHISIETLRPYLGVNVFEIVHEIVDACLLIGNEDGTNSLHDLVRDYLIETLDDNLRTYNKLFINQYYEYYNGKWESFPQNDDYFLNNYINIAVEEELTDKAKEITNKLLCTYKYLQKEWIIDSIKLLELNPHNVAKILLRNAVRYDVFLWILSLLEKTQVDVIAFAERYLENAEPKNSDFTIETIKVLGEDNPTVETFSEDYLKNVEPKDSKITVQAIRVLGKDNSTVKKFSKGYLKNVEAKNSDITLETIKVLGEDNHRVKKFSKGYLKNVEPKDSDITLEAIKVLGEDNHRVKTFSKGYLKNVEPKDSKITVKTINVLGKGKRRVKKFSEDYLNNVEPKNPFITAETINVLGEDDPSARTYSENYLNNVEPKNPFVTAAIIYVFCNVNDCVRNYAIEFLSQTEIDTSQFRIEIACIKSLGYGDKNVIEYASNIVGDYAKYWDRHHRVQPQLLLIEFDTKVRKKIAEFIIERCHHMNRAVLNSALIVLADTPEANSVCNDILINWKAQISTTTLHGKVLYYWGHIITSFNIVIDKEFKDYIINEILEESKLEANDIPTEFFTTMETFINA